MSRKYLVTIDGATHQVDLIARSAQQITFVLNEKTHTVSISSECSIQQISQSAFLGQDSFIPSSVAAVTIDGNIRAPMPGIVSKIACAVGDKVSKAAPLLVIEAMKMENNIFPPTDAQVISILVAAGDEVKKGQLLVELKSLT